MLLGTNRAEDARNQALRTILDAPLWSQLDDRIRMGVLSGLVEAYAQLKDANQSLAALLTLWREQAKVNHTDPSPRTPAVLRRGALLRTPPENLSAQQSEDLRRLCLENPIENGPPSMADPSEMIARVPAGVTVLVYFVGARTWLWRLERGAAPVLIPLGEPRGFDISLTRFLNKFTGRNTSPGWEPDSANLYDHLVKPVGEFHAHQVLAIAGAGYFRGLSFDALGPTGGKLLGEQFPIVYVEDLLADPPAPRNLPRRAEIIGAGGLSLLRADDEAGKIAELLGVSALVGQNARRAGVVNGMREATWIHFSTHGFVDAFNPYRSYLALTDNEQIQGFELPEMARAAAMITISACDSNVSSVRIGDAPQPEFARGLTTFAHAAGAQWVLSSLWKAEDTASRDLMVPYYEHLLKGESPAIALFNAKSDWRSPGCQPFLVWSNYPNEWLGGL